MHTIDVQNRFYSSAIVSGYVGIAVGVALGLRKAHSNRKVYCFCGDGSTDEGWFTEAWKYAVGWNLPITFVIEDNNRSVCTDQQSRWGMKVTFPFTDKIIYYRYTPAWPHVGSGREIEW